MNNSASRFQAYWGYEVGAGGRTLAIHAAAGAGKPLNDSDLRNFHDAIGAYLDTVVGRPVAVHKRRYRPLAVLPDALPDFAVKVVTDEVLGFLLGGNFQIATPAYYRMLERGPARDAREAYGVLYAEDLSGRSLAVSVTGGYHYLLFCASRASVSRALGQLSKFGTRLVRINRLQEFANGIAQRIGASGVLVHDVQYSDYKLRKVKSESAGPLIDAWPGSDLPADFFQTLSPSVTNFVLKEVSLPFLFSKTRDYVCEMERRLAFEMPTDCDEPVLRFHAPELVEHIEVLR